MRHELSSKTHVGIACVGFFLIALFLTAYSAKNRAIARIGNQVVLGVVAPISGVAEFLLSGAGGLLERYLFLVRVSARNEDLTSRINKLEGELAAVRESERENLRLREILRIKNEHALSGITATIVGGDPSGWVKGIVVNRGSAAGVRLGMAVVHPRGVVGQVISVTRNSARVLLVSDHASGVDVLAQNSRARGVLEGAGDNVCELKFIPKEISIKEGEQIITSGMDRIYPKGILVGRVAQIGQPNGALFQTIEVRPAVDFSRIEEVLIVASNNELAAADMEQAESLVLGKER